MTHVEAEEEGAIYWSRKNSGVFVHRRRFTRDVLVSHYASGTSERGSSMGVEVDSWRIQLT